MEAASRHAAPVTSRIASRIDFMALSAWGLSFGLVAYLGLNQGGYAVFERSEIGILAPWTLIVATVAGGLPLAGGTRLGRAALLVLALFAAWTAVSLLWTSSDERTIIEAARVGCYVAIFALALGARSWWRELLFGVTAAVVLICGVALVSRLDPNSFAQLNTGEFFSQNVVSRLAYPLTYSSALGALAAIGLPLLIGASAAATSIAAQAVHAAAIPACALTLWLTASGLSVPAAALGLAVFFALTDDRLPKLATLIVGGIGSAILFAAVDQRPALDLGLTGAKAETEGSELLIILLVVCAGVGLIQAAVGLLSRYAKRPRLLSPTPLQTRAGLIVGVIAVIAAAMAAGLPGEASDAWEHFKSQPDETAVQDTRAGQILEYSSNGRFDMWTAALDAGRTEPVTGIGAGTFEFWWAQEGEFGFVRDAHSLFFETFAELGIIGLVLIGLFAAAVIAIGAARTWRAPPGVRVALAAALGGSVGFLVAASVDWVWELAVLPVIFLILAAVVIAGDTPESPTRPKGSSPLALMAAFAVVALAGAVIAANAVVLATTEKVDSSQGQVRAGNLDAALVDARDAAAIQNFAATPRLQEALVLEQQGQLGAAATAARLAADKEADNWRNWFVLSRLEARIGNPEAAVEAYRTARELSPRSAILQP